MAWSTPPTFTGGAAPGSANLQIISDDETYLRGDTTWTTVVLLGWTNLGAPYANVAYRKAGDIVYLRGVATGGTPSGVNTVFTLPTGYRPVAGMARVASSGGAAGQCSIATTGAVTIAAGSSTYFSFDGVSFPIV